MDQETKQKLKSEGIQLLKDMALAHSRTKHPTLPEHARTIHKYSDRNANSLTRAVIDFLRFSGHQAERISSTGRYLDKSIIITDVLGRSRRIGSGQWIPGTGTRGTADISVTIRGKSVKIEIKVGRDRQSEAQKQYQQQVEQAGGVYWLCHSFDEFLSLYNDLV